MSLVKKKRRHRRTQILGALLDAGALPLSELGRRTEISLPVVTRIIGALKAEGMVAEVDAPPAPQTGRPPSFFKLNGRAGYLLGIDLDRVHTHYLLLDLEQRILAEREDGALLPTEDPAVLDHIEATLRALTHEAGVAWRDVLGLGFSIPGIVRGDLGTSETHLNFGPQPLGDVLRDRFQKPVRIENDAKAMALGERWFGAAQDVSHALCLKYAWGLGLGILIDGRLYYGKSGFAGEVGHIQVVPDGPLCYCGKRGCLETVSSGRAITRIAREKLQQGAASILRNGDRPIDALDSAAILDAANRGDLFSIEILEEAGRYLGQGIAMLINIFNPEKVIIGGDMARVAEYIIDAIRTTAIKQSFVQLNHDVQFDISRLGARAGSLGVARLLARALLLGR